MSGRRLDVTATQAVSSMLAALTGAIAASGLGIAGTIIGAAFMSLAGTVGAAIYKHYLGRSREKLREAATSLAPKAATHPAAAAVLRHSLRLDPELTARLRPDGQAVVETKADPPGADHEQPAALADTRVETAVAGPARHARATTGAPSAFTRDDSAAAAVAANIAAAVLGDRSTLGHESLGYTAAEHPVTDPDDGARTTATGLGTAGATGLTARLGNPADRTVADRTVADPGSAPTATWAAAASAAGDGGAADSDRPPGGGTGSRSPARRRRRWLAMAGAVLATFVVAMSAVTAVEAIAGKPLESLIWHKSGSGTTIGNVVENRPSSRATTTPGTSSTPGQSPSARPGSTSPSPSTTSPAPTPSTSVSPSLQTSPSPTSSPSGSTGTSAAPSAPATSPAAG
jgi:hypothetical protein